jgi:hypothetical protein
MTRRAVFSIARASLSGGLVPGARMLPCRLGEPRARDRRRWGHGGRRFPGRDEAGASRVHARPGRRRREAVRSGRKGPRRRGQPRAVSARGARHRHGRREAGHPHRGRRGFVTGVLLMAGSFLVYPAYAVVVLWPVSDRTRIALTLVAAAVSWGVFSAGLYLTGRRGWIWLRRRWKGHYHHRPAPPPPSATP